MQRLLTMVPSSAAEHAVAQFVMSTSTTCDIQHHPRLRTYRVRKSVLTIVFRPLDVLKLADFIGGAVTVLAAVFGRP